ncbi:MAG TPA: PilZ domain-containing protein [Burkholderiales bacterium]|nr:PilZ domain-containing protein [Burkholderiales bacterium]
MADDKATAKPALRPVAGPPGVGARPGVLSLTIKDKSALYAAYMPFVKGGGIFVPSSRSYKLGEEVFMLLTLMESKEKIPVAGHVIWVTPAGAQGGRTAGIGIQFNEKDSGLARSKIETLLAGHMNSDRPTHTM